MTKQIAELIAKAEDAKQEQCARVRKVTGKSDWYVIVGDYDGKIIRRWYHARQEREELGSNWIAVG